MPASSITSSTIFATPNFISPLSVTTNAFLKPSRATTPGSSLRAPGPKYDTSFKINLFAMLFIFKELIYFSLTVFS